MTTSTSVTSSVEVAVDPATAFDAFTGEIGLWWTQGPINFWDSTRAWELRMEPGVGGRIIEVYDAATGEGLELARITEWEPGRKLAWRSSLDDVEVEVLFEPAAAGTSVLVVASVPAGGRDEGGTAWVRTLGWFSSWMARRDHVPHEPFPLSRLAVAVHYERPVAAARWLMDAFGFEPASFIPDEEPADHCWIEFHVGDAALILHKQAEQQDGAGPVTHTPWVFVDDLDAHLARARAAGATIVQDIWHHGVRAYEAADPEGRHWSFAQATPRMR
jgi:uncharacterized glyoxalase superfamily protein PhnB